MTKHPKSKTPLKPHSEQDGWVYVRVMRWRTDRKQRYAVGGGGLVPGRGLGDFIAYYHDHEKHKQSRIISSRRVEEAVETADYLKRCADEGLAVMWHPLTAAWYVGHGNEMWFHMEKKDRVGGVCSGDTVREAYYRHHNSRYAASE